MTITITIAITITLIMFLAALSREKTSSMFKGKGNIPRGAESKIIDLWTSDPVGTYVLVRTNLFMFCMKSIIVFYHDHGNLFAI